MNWCSLIGNIDRYRFLMKQLEICDGALPSQHMTRIIFQKEEIEERITKTAVVQVCLFSRKSIEYFSIFNRPIDFFLNEIFCNSYKKYWHISSFPIKPSSISSLLLRILLQFHAIKCNVAPIIFLATVTSKIRL